MVGLVEDDLLCFSESLANDILGPKVATKEGLNVGLYVFAVDLYNVDGVV